MRIISRSILVAAFVLPLAGRATAQDAQLQQILDRLDRMEKENRDLRQTVQSQQQQLETQNKLLKQLAPEEPAAEKPAAAGAVSAASQPAKDDKLEKAVEKYLKEKDKKKDDKKPEAAQFVEVGSDLKVDGAWKNGITFQTKDKAFRLQVGGVIQFDMGWFGGDPAIVKSIGTFNSLVDPTGTLQDGMDFRRARLRMSGLAFEQIEYFAQYEFANALDLRQRTLGIPNPAGVASPNVTNFDPNETVGFNEVYIGLVRLPVIGNIRVGRHRESLNFVTATQDNNQIWLERGLMFDAFNGNYNFSNGITTSRTYFDDRAYTLFGFFQQNNNNNRQFASVGDGNYVYDGRITFLPCYDEDDQLWVHVGADYSYRNLSQDNVRYRGRPNLRVGSSFQVPNIVDTSTIFSRDAQQIANLEFAAACGPWTMAAEVTHSWVTNAFTGGLPNADGTLPKDVVARGTYRAQGAYVELFRFLTPDHRPYRKERPGYERVTPTSNFFWIEGDDGRKAFNWGGWEVGARYDYVDLTNAGINGGTARGITGAVNWYFSSNMRIQANYIWMHRAFNPADNAGRLTGDFNGFGVRFNCDF